jgi:ATP synthase protein I
VTANPQRGCAALQHGNCREAPETDIIEKFALAGNAEKNKAWRAGVARVISPLKTRPIRTVLIWQVVVTMLIAAIAGIWTGGDGALSATLGGLVNFAAGVMYAFLLGVGLGKTRVPEAGASLIAMFRAEAGKILVILGGLWLTLATYTDVVLAAFFAAFVLTVVVFSMAIFVRE